MAHYYKQIQGYCDYYEFLSWVAGRLPNKGARIAEVGVWNGQSVCYLGEILHELAKQVEFFAVDTFRGSETENEHRDFAKKAGGSVLHDFAYNMKIAGLLGKISVIGVESVRASRVFEDNSLDYVFIDADHRYGSVTDDLNAWYSKVKEGGIFAGHDYFHEAFPEVKAAVDSFAKERGLELQTLSTCWYIIKSKDE